MNDVDKGKRVAHYFKKGEKGTNAAGWCKGMIVEVLTSGNLRIKYEDGIRLAIPKAIGRFDPSRRKKLHNSSNRPGASFGP